jgi:hypothetical protein
MDLVGWYPLTFFTVEDRSASLRVLPGAMASARCIALAGGVLDSDAGFRPRTCAPSLVGFVTLGVFMVTSS